MKKALLFPVSENILADELFRRQWVHMVRKWSSKYGFTGRIQFCRILSAGEQVYATQVYESEEDVQLRALKQAVSESWA